MKEKKGKKTNLGLSYIAIIHNITQNKTINANLTSSLS